MYVYSTEVSVVSLEFHGWNLLLQVTYDLFRCDGKALFICGVVFPVLQEREFIDFRIVISTVLKQFQLRIRCEHIR